MFNSKEAIYPKLTKTTVRIPETYLRSQGNMTTTRLQTLSLQMVALPMMASSTLDLEAPKR